MFLYDKYLKRLPLRVLILWAGVLLSAGCQRAVPVDEISVEQSGIQVTRGDSEPRSVPWSGWRGPAQNGLAPAQSLVTTWSETQNVRWRQAVPGRGHASPVLTDSLVLLATADEQAEQQMVVAFARDDGSVQWQTVVHEGDFPPRRAIHAKATHANSTLACDGRYVFATFFNAGKIVATALDLRGERQWQTEVGPFRSKFGYAPSPILYGSYLIVVVDSSGGSYLAALDTSSGEIAWRVNRPAVDSYSSPAIVHLGNRDQLVISGGNQVTSYDPATGSQYWTAPGVAEGTCGTIVAQGERLFASGGFPQRETVCLDNKGERIWSHRTRLYEPSLLAVQQRLFGITDDGVAYCWDGLTGKEIWKKRLGGSFSASPLYCQDRIYVSNLSGQTFVFSATADRYESLAVNQLGSDCYASPAVAEGQLYLRIGVGKGSERREQLVCLGATEDATQATP